MPDDRIRALIRGGKDQLIAQVKDVSRLLEGPIANIDDIAAARAITHQIKGTSGSIGFDELAAAAAALDEELQTILRRSEVGGAASSRYSNLLAELQSIADRTRSERSALYDTDLTTLTKR